MLSVSVAVVQFSMGRPSYCICCWESSVVWRSTIPVSSLHQSPNTDVPAAAATAWCNIWQHHTHTHFLLNTRETSDCILIARMFKIQRRIFAHLQHLMTTIIFLIWTFFFFFSKCLYIQIIIIAAIIYSVYTVTIMIWSCK